MKLAPNRISLAEAARRVRGYIAVNAELADSTMVAEFQSADRISDLLNAASESVLLVTELANAQLARVAELMDVVGICLVNGTKPDPTLAAALKRLGTVLLVAPTNASDTLARLRSGAEPPIEKP